MGRAVCIAYVIAVDNILRKSVHPHPCMPAGAGWCGLLHCWPHYNFAHCLLIGEAAARDRQCIRVAVAASMSEAPQLYKSAELS